MKKLSDLAIVAIAVLLLAAAPLSSVSATAPPATGPRTLVEGFHSKLLDVMKNARTLGIEGRFARLEPEVGRSFDIPLMMALTTGKYWRDAKPGDQKRLVEAFKRFSAATYASRFDGFSGQSFETVAVQPGPRQTQLVETQLRQPHDPPVAITYVTRATATAWRIVDVLVDHGISELAVRRSEYHSVLSSGGVDGLVRLLDNKTKQLLAKE